MSALTSLLIPLETGEGGFSVGTQNFDFPPIIPGVEWANRYLLQAVVSVVLIIAFWVIMAGKTRLVPTKGQFLGESAYFFIRNSIARDNLGHDFKKFLPFLIALFSFVLINNLWGVFPLTLLPTASHVGWAYGLALMVWVIYIAVGVAKHGPWGYLKMTVLPSGVPWFMWFLIIPLEFASNLIVRPITLALRLFANMFAGHLLVLVFVLGGEYLILETEPIFNKAAGVVSLIFSMAIFALEIFVQSLQAFIFVVLTAVYLASSLADEH